MTDADLHAARQTDLNIAFAKSDWKEREMTMPSEPPKYPNDTPPEQIEALIEGCADLQKQILRRFAQSVLEEMRYHLWVAQEKCKVFEQTTAEQRAHAEAETRRADELAAEVKQKHEKNVQIYRRLCEAEAALAEAKRDAEINAIERNRQAAIADGLITHLSSILALLQPDGIKLADGRFMEFRPPTEKVLEYWIALSKAIYEIPQAIEKAKERK